MAKLRIQHAWQGVSGIPSDRYVNTFYAEGSGPTQSTELEDIDLAIRNFYDQVHAPSTHPLVYWLNSTLDTIGRTVKIYDMDDPLPRAPKFTSETAVNNIGTTTDNLPTEVALCLSYAAPAISGTIAANRRGRIYIGPLNSRALYTASADSNTLPNPDLQNALVNSAAALKTALAAINGHQWSMWSPTLEVMMLINRVWVDNGWDTQRRRGIAPSGRVSLALP